MNDRIDELITLAALGELTASEQAELDAAAASDPEVAAELTATLETVAGLAAADPVEAPPSLRASVLDAIDGVDQVAPDAAGRPRTFDTAAAPSDDGHVAQVVPIRRRTFTWALTAAASVVLLVGLGWLVLADRGDDPVDSVASASDSVAREFEGDLGDSLVLFHSASEDAVALDGDGIADPSEGMVFVLWTIGADGATPVGEFVPGDDGTVSVRLDGVDPTGFDLGITEEIEGEADEPTLPIRASA